MKKLTTLVLAAGLVVSSFAGSASAGEFRPFAQFAEEFVYGDGGLTGIEVTPGATSAGQPPNEVYGGQKENFSAGTRIRFGFDYIQSEDLSATMMFQYGNHEWGKNHENLTRDPDAELRMRLAYIDWTIPTTDVKVRMGRQAVVTPSYAFGSPILDGRADAVSINGNVNDNISLGLTWMRLVSNDNNISYYFNDNNNHEEFIRDADDADAIMLQAEFAYDGWKLAPWAMFVNQNVGAYGQGGLPHTAMDKVAHGNAYVLGASFELSMFDPFVFAIDALYNKVDYSGRGVNKYDDYDGFYVGAKAAYKLNNGTVALKGWYATGDELTKSDENKYNSNGFVLLDGGFSATTMMFGDNIIGNDQYNTLTGDTPFGTWGIIAEYSGFSFLDKLTHTARIAYIQGTNEADNWSHNNYRYADSYAFSHLTDEDTVIEINFNSTYEIYQNLSATLELGYMFVDFGGTKDPEEFHGFAQDDVMRTALTFVYNF